MKVRCVVHVKQATGGTVVEQWSISSIPPERWFVALSTKVQSRRNPFSAEGPFFVFLQLGFAAAACCAVMSCLSNCGGQKMPECSSGLDFARREKDVKWIKRVWLRMCLDLLYFQKHRFRNRSWLAGFRQEVSCVLSREKHFPNSSSKSHL